MSLANICTDQNSSNQLKESNCNYNNCNASNLTPNKSFELALLLYSICFSIIKTCNYWKSETLKSLYDHGKVFYEQSFASLITDNNFPSKIQIYDAEIHVSINNEKHVKMFCNTTKQELQQILLENTKNNTAGFLARMSDQYLACIFHNKLKVVKGMDHN